ncbi:MAG: GDP-mannose 4,6-dehydratase [Anaerolineae bacterium CG1_02_58_13]|nr:MAG: GDP-mannose 4,6-dehydratase [Anaerolineae bacterium CG1_02_58_13]
MPTAVITGITGQDGSYLAELLLSKGYKVVGVARRASTVNYERIEHLLDNITVVQGDLSDQGSLISLLEEHKPSEVYNLAAQSFVPTSWNQPALTGDVTALGVTRILEAIRYVDPKTRFYQASSSEMFGKVVEVPQREATPFYPRSPYGVAKVYGHFITINYRESFNIFAVSGILFNHECVTAETPVIIRRHGLLDILPIEDVVPHRTEPHTATKFTTEADLENPLEVWDAQGWTTTTCMTATWNGFELKPNKTVCRIAARGAVYQTTEDHQVFTLQDGDPLARHSAEVRKGDRLALIELPLATDVIRMTEEEAWLLGFIAAEGYVSENGKIQISNQDSKLLEEVAELALKVTGGGTRTNIVPSGFETGNPVIQLHLTGANGYGRYIRDSLYTRSGHKRVPQRVLNAAPKARLAFLRGYNAGDGLKQAPTRYEFKSFKTASASLAAALYWLIGVTLNQRAIICLEEREGHLYYQINLNSPDVPGQKGQHLQRPLDEVVKASPISYNGWLFDLATASGTFHAGIGQGWIHNSPRRGLEFVTRKITDAVARIKLGMAKEVRLGNLESQRDWGFAGDYVDAMWRMLQQDQPDNFVIGTGVTHSVQEFCEIAFGRVGLDYKDHVVVDERYYRPAEVDLLIADASKAGKILGWEPQVEFKQLVEMMVDSDLKRLNGKAA